MCTENWYHTLLCYFFYFFRRYLCLILCNVNMFVFFRLVTFITELYYFVLCKDDSNFFYLHSAPNLYLKMGKCNKRTMYLWSGVGKSVAYRREKPLIADKSIVLHLQIRVCATQTSTFRLPESSGFCQRPNSIQSTVTRQTPSFSWKFCYTYVFVQREALFWLLRWGRIYIICTRHRLLLSIQGKLCWTCEKTVSSLFARVEQFWRTTI